MGLTGTSILVQTSSLVCANDISISRYVIEEILIKFVGSDYAKSQVCMAPGSKICKSK